MSSSKLAVYSAWMVPKIILCTMTYRLLRMEIYYIFYYVTGTCTNYECIYFQTCVMERQHNCSIKSYFSSEKLEKAIIINDAEIVCQRFCTCSSTAFYVLPGRSHLSKRIKIILSVCVQGEMNKAVCKVGSA